jgi:flagellar biosynthesis/type III secretory pathway protein FliH
MTSDPKNKKFLFDLHHFDEETEEEKKKKNPPAPTFSMQDMDNARSEAFEKGKTEGLQAAKDSIVQRTELVVQSIAGNLSALEMQETERSDLFKQNNITLTHKALKKAFPELLDQTASAQIKLFLNDFFEETRIKSGFVLYVHPDIETQLNDYIPKFQADITLKADDTLAPNASKIEWEKGHAYFDPDSMAKQLLDIIAQQVADKAELLDESVKKPHNENRNADSGTKDKDT